VATPLYLKIKSIFVRRPRRDLGCDNSPGIVPFQG